MNYKSEFVSPTAPIGIKIYIILYCNAGCTLRANYHGKGAKMRKNHKTANSG